MDQKKAGAFLKQLRKEKSLTQEQLAEHLGVSSRSVSRWETGSNMPDLDMLIELADFYDTDIREIIDGERKSEPMDRETKDTLKKVADYAAVKEKKSKFKLVYGLLCITAVLLVSTVLFVGETKGLLYGIVPEVICDWILRTVWVVAGLLLIAYLRVHWAMEKPSPEPEKTVMATVVSREIRSGTNQTGRSMMGYSFAVTFQTETGQTLELYTYEVEYGGLKEGMRGALTYQGRYFVSFAQI